MTEKFSAEEKIMSTLDDLKQNVLDGNAPATQNLVKQALAEGLPAEIAANKTVQSAYLGGMQW